VLFPNASLVPSHKTDYCSFVTVFADIAVVVLHFSYDNNKVPTKARISATVSFNLLDLCNPLHVQLPLLFSLDLFLSDLLHLTSPPRTRELSIAIVVAVVSSFLFSGECLTVL
jgi:hypothetical protein